MPFDHSLNRFSQPTKISGKNYFKDEVHHCYHPHLLILIAAGGQDAICQKSHILDLGHIAFWVHTAIAATVIIILCHYAEHFRFHCKFILYRW